MAGGPSEQNSSERHLPQGPSGEEGPPRQLVRSAAPGDLPRALETRITLQMNISILHHDEHYVAIHKPAGMLVHRSPIDRHETVFALQLTRDAIGQRVYPVHRLDKPTSGVLLFALNPDVANQTMRLFQDQQVEKIYRAIVRGYTEPEGNIDYPLIEKKDRVAEPLATPATQPQPAVTHYLQKAQVELDHPVGRYATARYSYVELRPSTWSTPSAQASHEAHFSPCRR